MVYRQAFYNEYAYDDGVPELGYTLEPAGAELAYRFKINVPDTLRAVRIYFNKMKNSSSQFFDLVIWRDNNGKPGEEIYRQRNLKVHWDKGLYPFATYVLDTARLISGTFYVGYQQQNQSLNVGFDTQHDVGKNIFYYAENVWYNTRFKGALLIRPVVGGQEMITGTGRLGTREEKALNVYPNPAQSQLRFTARGLVPGTAMEVAVYNLFGQMVSHRVLHRNFLNIRFLSNGMYLLRISSNHRVYSTKFIVKH